MDPMEAMEVTRDELEQENLADDNLIHRDEEAEPQVKDDLAGELTTRDPQVFRHHRFLQSRHYVERRDTPTLRRRESR